MPQDRGSIKWTSLMLPEHVELLKDLWREDEKVEKPLLDSQQIELNHNQLQMAFMHEEQIRLRYYSNGFIHEISGKIEKLDQGVFLQTDENEEIRIPFHQILTVSV